MSGDDTPNTPAPRDRREAVREKAQQVQAQQSKALVIRRTSLIVVLAAIVAAVAVVITWAVTSSASSPDLSPANMTHDGIRVEAVGTVEDPADTGGGTLTEVTPTPTAAATPTATPTPSTTAAEDAVDIHVYVDYLSPGSKEFQVANAKQLADWVSQGAATLTYHPVALLTPKSNGTKYSLRSASAAACVATYSPATFFSFNQSLLERQPQVAPDGFSDKVLADMAIASGGDDPKRLRTCIEGEDFSAWVQDATERALAGPLPGSEDATLTGAPLVLVNGQPYVGNLDDPKEFAQFVLTLSSAAYYTSTPSPTPSPTVVVPSPTPTK
jgi:protein-disulfide isomerase